MTTTTARRIAEILTPEGVDKKGKPSRIPTTYGPKTREGIANLIESESKDPAREKAWSDLLHFAELVAADLNDRKTGWYYQFTAAVDKVRKYHA